MTTDKVEIVNITAINKPQYIIIHHSATKQGDAETFRKYHIEINGWKDIGYHYVINNGTYKPDGLIEVGREENDIGAHALGYNDKSIGICLVGNFDEDKPTEKQLKSLRKLCRYLMQKYNIPIQNVLGHRETGAKKSCPGNNVNMDEVRNMLANKVIKLKINSNKAILNEKEYELSVAPKIENGKTLIGLRDIAKLLGYEAIFNDKTREITLMEG